MAVIEGRRWGRGGWKMDRRDTKEDGRWTGGADGKWIGNIFIIMI